jgi:hypothetical protein
VCKVIGNPVSNTAGSLQEGWDCKCPRRKPKRHEYDQSMNLKLIVSSITRQYCKNLGSSLPEPLCEVP